MAVGNIITCAACSESYDDGRTSHIYCDGGQALRDKEEAVAIFNSMSVDDRLEYLFRALQSLTDRVEETPYITGNII